MEQTASPSAEVFLSAQILLANQKIFDFVQNLQKQTAEQRKGSYDDLKRLDVQVDTFSEQSMKVRDREIRQTLMNSIVEFKQKIAQVMEVMRADTQSNISNVLIAQLNDVAYKAIRKKGVQKKLDERAIKNEGLYKKLDGQLKGIIKKLDIPKLKE